MEPLQTNNSAEDEQEAFGSHSRTLLWSTSTFLLGIFVAVLGCVFYFSHFGFQSTDTNKNSDIIATTTKNTDDKLLKKYETVIDSLPYKGVLFEALGYKTEWSGNQADKDVSPAAIMNSSVVEATKSDTGDVLWVSPVDPGNNSLAISKNGDLLVITLGRTSSITVLDTMNGTTEQRIPLDVLGIGQCNFSDQNNPAWKNFITYVLNKDANEIYLFAYADSKEQDHSVSGRESDYYILRYNIASSVDKWLANSCGTQRTLGENFVWGTKVDWPSYHLLLDEKANILLALSIETKLTDSDRMWHQDQENVRLLKINPQNGKITASTTVSIVASSLDHVDTDGKGNPVFHFLDGTATTKKF